MPINVAATSGSPLFGNTHGQGQSNHDVVDIVNAKAYRHIRNISGGALSAGEAYAQTLGVGAGLASLQLIAIIGIAISNIANNDYGYVQSLGVCTAKVAAGTPANSVLVPASTGVLRALDIAGPEAAFGYLALLDQRIRITPGSSYMLDYSPVRCAVSLTAESGGTASVFIF